ncbi:MAG: COQ9 family protein [Paracoccaceae bacterium]|jgi:ubiquinone biosynthesis protein COQ9|nr:COQ9 family protein [Paracoccaceae bacterium]
MPSQTDLKTRLLDAALSHVAFDGWSNETLKQAAKDCDVEYELAKTHYPRGAVDLALAYHHSGDDKMVAGLAKADFSQARFRDRIIAAVRLRLESADIEAVRRGVTLFAMPQNAGDGAKAIWGTADRIWSELGDTSQDVNWYTKRATLSAVYSSVVLYWLGDTSDDFENTWAFLDRRIENVMQFEKTKAKLRENPLVKGFMNGPGKFLERIKSPDDSGAEGFPGYWPQAKD